MDGWGKKAVVTSPATGSQLSLYLVTTLSISVVGEVVNLQPHVLMEESIHLPILGKASWLINNGQFAFITWLWHNQPACARLALKHL